jgi:hypothetical protein
MYKKMTKKEFTPKYSPIQSLKAQSFNYIQKGYQKMVEQTISLIPKKSVLNYLV